MSGLSLFDWIVLAGYLAAMLGIGFAVTGRQRSTREYFKASQQMHWLPVALAVVASLFSGIYLIGIRSIFDSSNKFLGFFGGALLGIFLLGTLTRRAKALPTVLGGLLGVSVVFALDAVRAVFHQTYVHEYLYAAISCLLTMLFGYFGSFLGSPLTSEQLHGLTVSTMEPFEEYSS